MCQDCSKVWKEKKESVRPALPDCPCTAGLIISADGRSSQKRRNWSQTGSAFQQDSALNMSCENPDEATDSSSSISQQKADSRTRDLHLADCE